MTSNGTTSRRRTGAYAAVTIAAAVLASGACETLLGPSDDAELIEALPRAFTDSEVAVISRSSDFGLRLMSEILERDSGPNVVLSPLSASMALGMTLNGASGSTFDGMRSALGFDGLTQDEINVAYRGLLDLLRGLDPSVELSVANSAWANRRFSFLPAFFDTVREHFGAEVESLSFSDPASLARINRWADEHTGGRIPTILDALTPDQALILLNAVYFEGSWTTRFDPAETRPGPFRRSDGSEVSVDMMRATDLEVSVGGAGELRVAELPYGGGAFTMLVAVPTDDSPGAAFEIMEAMDEDRWASLIASLGEPRRLDLVSLPRFTLSYDVLLNDPLAEMGMAEAFTPNADFSGMSVEPLCIDFVRQKTFIEVDEAGTRAAAVTAVGIGPASFSAFTVDRPFIFAIRERLSGTLLFLGVVGDPSLESAARPSERTPTCG